MLDVRQFGDKATLYLADCMDVIGNVRADVLISDPPFSLQNGGSEKVVSKKGTRTLRFGFDDPLQKGAIVNSIVEVGRNVSAFFVFCGSSQMSYISDAMNATGFTVKPFTWIKSCPPPPPHKSWWPSAFELAIFGFRKGAWFGDDNTRRNNVLFGDALRNGNSEKVGHPTQKPIWVMSHIVRSICAPGATVFDPYAGSGTTGVAAIRFGRRFIGIEKDPKYFKMAVRRISEEVGRDSMLDCAPVNVDNSKKDAAPLFENM